MQEKVRIGIIGGSGLYQMDGIEEVTTIAIDTLFGKPSDELIIGKINGEKIAFLARHRRGHCIMPTEINFRANIYALKSIGVEWIISISAVGSLREELQPLDMVIPDQVFDYTKQRISTFFGEGMVAHVGMADPFCPTLSQILFDTATDAGCCVHKGGTYVCIEGPQFSTRAESNTYRQLGFNIIGMTAMPEAKLAREAQICYATLAMVTDYDVWHESAHDVTVEMVIENLNKNVANARKIVRDIINRIPQERGGSSSIICGCASALKDAIITNPEMIPDETRKKLSLLL
ncbi:MAG: S-methyl-5'-thioadenosine phosphorylase [bacterium]|nr:S-methyl-5'-thioadenosine phosphorylase [bacterium]